MSVVGQEDAYISQLIECAIAETESSRKAEEIQATRTNIFPSNQEVVSSSNSVFIQSSFGLDDPFFIKQSSDNKFSEAKKNSDWLWRQNVFRNKNTRINSGYISKFKEESELHIDLVRQENTEEIFEAEKAGRKKFENHYFQSFMSRDPGRHTNIISDCSGVNLCSFSEGEVELDDNIVVFANIDDLHRSEMFTGASSSDTISESTNRSHTENDIGANVNCENDVDSVLICGQCGLVFINSAGLDKHTEEDHREKVKGDKNLHLGENEYLKWSEQMFQIQRQQRKGMKSNSETTVDGGERTQSAYNERSAGDSCSEVNTGSQTQQKQQRRNRKKKPLTSHRKRTVANSCTIGIGKDRKDRQIKHDDVQQDVADNESHSDDDVILIEPKIDLLVIDSDDDDPSPVKVTADDHLSPVKVTEYDHLSPVNVTESDITKQFGIKNVCVSLNRVMPTLPTSGRTSPRKHARITDCSPVKGSLIADQLLLKKHGIKAVTVNVTQQKVLRKKLSVNDSNTDSLPGDNNIKSTHEKTNSLDSERMKKDRNNDSSVNVTKSQHKRQKKEIGILKSLSVDDNDQSNIAKPNNTDSEGTKCDIKSISKSPYKKQNKESVNESSIHLHVADINNKSNDNKSRNSELEMMKKYGIKNVSVDVSKSPIDIPKSKNDKLEQSISVLASCTKSAFTPETADDNERKKKFENKDFAVCLSRAQQRLKNAEKNIHTSSMDSTCCRTDVEDLKKFGIKNVSISLSRSELSLPDTYKNGKARSKRPSHNDGDQTVKNDDLDGINKYHGAKDPPICLPKSPHKADRTGYSDIAKKYGIRDVSVCLSKTPLKFLDQGKRAGILAWSSSNVSDAMVDPVSLVSDMDADRPVSERSDFSTRFDDGLSTVSGRSTGSMKPNDEISIISNRSVSPQPSTSSGYIYIPRKRKRTARKSTKDEALRRQYSVKESSVLLQNLSSIEISMIRNPHSPYGKVNWLNYVVDSDSDGHQDDEVSVISILDNFDDNFDDGFGANDIIDMGKGKAPNNKSAKFSKIKTSEINSTETSVSFKDTSDANLLRKFGITRSIVVLQQTQSNDRKCKENEVHFTKHNSAQIVPSTRNTNENLKRKLSDADTLNKHKDASDLPVKHGSATCMKQVLSKICQRVKMSPSKTDANIRISHSAKKRKVSESIDKNEDPSTVKPFVDFKDENEDIIAITNDIKDDKTTDITNIKKDQKKEKNRKNLTIEKGQNISKIKCIEREKIRQSDNNEISSTEYRKMDISDTKVSSSDDGKINASEDREDRENSPSKNGKFSASVDDKNSSPGDGKISTCDVIKIIESDDGKGYASDDGKISVFNDRKINASGEREMHASDGLNISVSHDGNVCNSGTITSVNRKLNKGDNVDDIVPFDVEDDNNVNYTVLPNSNGGVLISKPKTSRFNATKYLGRSVDTLVKPRNNFNVVDSSDDSVIGEFIIHQNKEAQQQ